MIFDYAEPTSGTPSNGYPSFCWHCGDALYRLRGGAVAFEQLRDPAGHLHRVHGACVDDAIGDGIEHLKRSSSTPE